MGPARGRAAALPTSLQRSETTIAPVVDAADAGWLALRVALWPGGPESEHRRKMAASLAALERVACYRKALT